MAALSVTGINLRVDKKGVPCVCSLQLHAAFFVTIVIRVHFYCFPNLTIFIHYGLICQLLFGIAHTRVCV